MRIFLSQSTVILQSEENYISKFWIRVHLFLWYFDRINLPFSQVWVKSPSLKKKQCRIVNSELLLLFCIVRISWDIKNCHSIQLSCDSATVWFLRVPLLKHLNCLTCLLLHLTFYLAFFCCGPYLVVLSLLFSWVHANF